MSVNAFIVSVNEIIIYKVRPFYIQFEGHSGGVGCDPIARPLANKSLVEREDIIFPSGIYAGGQLQSNSCFNNRFQQRRHGAGKPKQL